MFSDLEINGGEDYVPYVSQDPLNDPKSFIFRIKVFIHQNIFEILFCLFMFFFFLFSSIIIDMSKIDTTADDTYRYLNFDELPEFVEASDKVEISEEMRAAAKRLSLL